MHNTALKSTSAKRHATKTMAYTALFAALSSVLMVFAVPIPFIPPFLRIDLSGVPVLLAAFMFGPAPALAVTAVKDLINLFFSGTGGVGELADFIILGSFAVTAGLVYRRRRTRAGALLGCGCAAAVMVVAGMLSNRYLLIPFYEKIMPIEAILKMCAEVNPWIGNLDTYILFGAGPFNLIKAVILSFVTFVLYKRLHTLIQKH